MHAVRYSINCSICSEDTSQWGPLCLHCIVNRDRIRPFQIPYYASFHDGYLQIAKKELIIIIETAKIDCK